MRVWVRVILCTCVCWDAACKTDYTIEAFLSWQHLCIFLQSTCSSLLSLWLKWGRGLSVYLSVSLHLHYPDRHMGNLAAVAQQQLSALRDSINHQILCVCLTGASVPHSPSICCVEAEHSSLAFLLLSHHLQQTAALLNLQGGKEKGEEGDKKPTSGSWGTFNKALHEPQCRSSVSWRLDTAICSIANTVHSSVHLSIRSSPSVQWSKTWSPESQTSIQTQWRGAATGQNIQSLLQVWGVCMCVLFPL